MVTHPIALFAIGWESKNLYLLYGKPPLQRHHQAVNPLYQLLLDTYVSETNKVISTWRIFSDADLNYKPHPKSTDVGGILKHQLLSERRFFGEFLGTSEPPPDEVLPATLTIETVTAASSNQHSKRLRFKQGAPSRLWPDRRRNVGRRRS